MSKKVLVVGSCVVDLSFYTKRIPLVGETVMGKFEQGLGGKGFNQAVASSKGGTPTRFISAVGPFSEDAFSALFAQKLKQCEIEFALEEVDHQSTGAAAILIDEQGRNNIVVSLGANEGLSPKFLQKNQNMFRDLGVLLLQFETNFSAIETAIQLARELSPDALIVLNPAPALPNIPSEILENIDLLTPNETELAAISNCKISSRKDLAKACSSIKGPRAILATLGENGCYYFCSETTKTNLEYQSNQPSGGNFFPAFPVAAIDTAGAGDAFNGSFASAWLRENGNLSRSIEFASAAAGISVTRKGTSMSLPSFIEVNEYLKHNSFEKLSK